MRFNYNPSFPSLDLNIIPDSWKYICCIDPTNDIVELSADEIIDKEIARLEREVIELRELELREQVGSSIEGITESEIQLVNRKSIEIDSTEKFQSALTITEQFAECQVIFSVIYYRSNSAGHLYSISNFEFPYLRFRSTPGDLLTNIKIATESQHGKWQIHGLLKYKGQDLALATPEGLFIKNEILATRLLKEQKALPNQNQV